MIVRLRNLARILVLLLAATMTSGCEFATLVLPRPFALSRARVELLEEPVSPDSGSFLSWATEEPFLIVIHKDAHELSLYAHGRRIRRYPVVLGRNSGRKRFEGDRRTPSGLYRITTKRFHRKYGRFLDLNYPNKDDLVIFRQASARGLVPPDRPRPGRLIGIHGTDNEVLNRLGVDWTLGCVSMMNRDVEDLYQLVPEGTPVLIRDHDLPPRRRASAR